MQKLRAARLIVGVSPGCLCLQVSGGCSGVAGRCPLALCTPGGTLLPQHGHHGRGRSVLAWSFWLGPQSCPCAQAGSHVLRLPAACDLSSAAGAGRGHGAALPPLAFGAGLTPGHCKCRWRRQLSCSWRVVSGPQFQTRWTGRRFSANLPAPLTLIA